MHPSTIQTLNTQQVRETLQRAATQRRARAARSSTRPPARGRRLHRALHRPAAA